MRTFEIYHYLPISEKQFYGFQRYFICLKIAVHGPSSSRVEYAIVYFTNILAGYYFINF